MRPHPLPRLAKFELAWTDAAFDAIYPEPHEGTGLRGRSQVPQLPHGVASMDPAGFFDGVLASVPLEQALGLRLTLWMVALAPLFTIRKLGTIASIDADDRVRVLMKLLTSTNYVVRQLAMSFKAIATLLYAKSDAVRAAMTTPVQGARNAPASAPVAPVAPGAPGVSPGLISASRLTSRGKAIAEESGEKHDHAAA